MLIWEIRLIELIYACLLDKEGECRELSLRTRGLYLAYLPFQNTWPKNRKEWDTISKSLLSTVEHDTTVRSQQTWRLRIIVVIRRSRRRLYRAINLLKRHSQASRASIQKIIKQPAKEPAPKRTMTCSFLFYMPVVWPTASEQRASITRHGLEVWPIGSRGYRSDLGPELSLLDSYYFIPF